MKSALDDARKTKLLCEKRVEDLNYKAKHIRLNGVDFNDDVSKELDQVESEQDELRPTLLEAKALSYKSVTKMMAVRDGISNLAILVGEDRNAVNVDKYEGLADVLDRFAQRTWAILSALGNPSGKASGAGIETGALSSSSAGGMGAQGLDLGGLDGGGDLGNLADGGDGSGGFGGSRGGSRGADRLGSGPGLGLISENDDFVPASSSLIRGNTLGRGKLAEFGGGMGSRLYSRSNMATSAFCCCRCALALRRTRLPACSLSVYLSLFLPPSLPSSLLPSIPYLPQPHPSLTFLTSLTSLAFLTSIPSLPSLLHLPHLPHLTFFSKATPEIGNSAATRMRPYARYELWKSATLWFRSSSGRTTTVSCSRPRPRCR